MNKLIGLLVLVSTFSAIADTPLFFLEERSGFVPEQYAFRKICEVTDTKARITVTKMSGETVTEKDITADPNWSALIKKAAVGKMKDTLMPADIGYYTTFTFLDEKIILLRGYNEDGMSRTNTSAAAVTLDEVIQKICE